MFIYILLVISPLLILYYIVNYYRYVSRFPPGPTPLPLIGNFHILHRINTHKQFDQFSKIYGPIFTVFAPYPMVIITKYDLIKEALVKQADCFAARPMFPLPRFNQSMLNGGIINATGEPWRLQRRFSLHTLRDFGMGQNIMEQKIMATVQTMLEHIDTLDSSRIDLFWPIQMCVANVINELLLGYHFKHDNCEKFCKVHSAINYAIRENRTRKTNFLIDSFPFLRHVPLIGWIGYGELHAEFDKLHQFIKQEIEIAKKTIDQVDEPTTFIQAYLKEMARKRVDGKLSEFSEEQLINVGSDFWLAGMETTSTTLRWAMLYMITNPNVQEKIQKEIDAVIGADRFPSMSDKTLMPYTSAAVIELQRKANIVSMNLPHSVVHDTKVGGISIPKDTIVVPQISSVLNDPDLFQNPEKFQPERFLQADGTTLRKDMIEYAIPFSMGKRQCAGEALARMELFLILTSLLQAYRIEIPENSPAPDLTPIFGGVLNTHPYSCRLIKRSVVVAGA